MTKRRFSSQPLMVVFNFLITFALQRAILAVIEPYKTGNHGSYVAVLNSASLLITVIPFIQGSHTILDRMFQKLETGKTLHKIEYVSHYVFIVLEGIMFVVAGEFVDHSAQFQDFVIYSFVFDIVLNVISIMLIGNDSLRTSEFPWLGINILFVFLLWGISSMLPTDLERCILLFVLCLIRTVADFAATFRDRTEAPNGEAVTS